LNTSLAALIHVLYVPYQVPDLLRRTPTDLIAVDSLALQWHEQSVLTPPLCMAGAPQLTTHTRMSYNLVCALITDAWLIAFIMAEEEAVLWLVSSIIFP
jgi:hypothetical protein